MMTDATQARIIAVPIAVLVAIPGESRLTHIHTDAPTLQPYLLMIALAVATALIVSAAIPTAFPTRWSLSLAAAWWFGNAVLAVLPGTGAAHWVGGGFLAALGAVAATISVVLHADNHEGSTL